MPGSGFRWINTHCLNCDTMGQCCGGSCWEYRKWWQTLRSVRLRSQSSHFTSKRGDLWAISTHGKNFPFGFNGVDACWDTHPLALMDTVLCLSTIFATLLALHSEAICACEWKIVTGLPWKRFQILIFCVVIAHSFPFLPLLHHYALLVMCHNTIK